MKIVLALILLTVLVLGRYLSRKSEIFRRWAWPALIFVFVLAWVLLYFPQGLFLTAVLLSGISFLWGLYCGIGSRVSASGLFSLLLTVGSFLAIESALLRSDAKVVQSIVPVNRGNLLLRKNGFRGSRPCTSCSKETIRIFTMGGSSTFGVPMVNPSDTYSAKLQRLVDERRVGKRFEVLNSGIAGYGLSQILDTIEVELLNLKPDVVTVCAWFNDSSPIPNWWGIPEKSDWEAYKMIRLLRWVEGIPGFSLVRRSRIFGVATDLLISLRDGLTSKASSEGPKKRGKSRVLRMSPQEFKEGLERLVHLSKKHDFLPVIIFEPLHRTKPLKEGIRGFKYYEAMREIARQHGVVLVDSLETFSKHANQRLFFDFIHPNQAGHTLMSEIIYRQLFNEKQAPQVKAFWESRGVMLGGVEPKRRHTLFLEGSSSEKRGVRFRARAPHLSDQEVTILPVVSGKQESVVRGVRKEWQTFELPLSSEATEKPIISIELLGRAIPPHTKPWQLGASALFAPVSVEVRSAAAQSMGDTEIRVRGENFVTPSNGFHLVTIDGDSGEVLLAKNFDPKARPGDGGVLVELLETLSNDSFHNKVVVLTLRGNGELSKQRERFSDALKKLGASGKLPSTGESFAMIAYASKSTRYAVEGLEKKQVELKIGERALHYSELIEIEGSELY